jgi:Type I restriction enzyme R protein N terminus (HSDR_N)
LGRKRILGKLTDFLSGREITDTDDERLRQKLARFLVEAKHYAKEEIHAKEKIAFEIDGQKIFSMADFVVKVDGISFMLVRYGPGSLVTRERPALACSRIIEDYEIPLTVVTNGIDAEILLTDSGNLLATGLDYIPDKNKALQLSREMKLNSLSPKRLLAEKRILSAYDYIEHSLECDDNWCEG